MGPAYRTRSKAKADRSDWTALPPGVWAEIAKLCEDKDFARIRQVCARWERGASAEVTEIQVVNGADLAPLQRFPSVRDLVVDGAIDSHQVRLLGDLGLTDLDVNGGLFWNKKPLRDALRSLDFGSLGKLRIGQCNRLSESLLSALPRTLVELTLWCCKGMVDMKALLSLPRLARLALEYCNVDTVAGLEGHPSLSDLSLSLSVRSKFDRTSVALLRNLTSFEIDHPGDDLKYLLRLPRLTSLHLGIIFDGCLDNLRLMTRLTGLKLPRSYCTSTLLAGALAELTALTSLAISFYEIEVLEAMRGMRSLRNLYMRYNGTMPSWWDAFKATAVRWDLEELNLVYHGLNGDKLHWLLDNLRLEHLRADFGCLGTFAGLVAERPPRHAGSVKTLAHEGWSYGCFIEEPHVTLERLEGLSRALSGFRALIVPRSVYDRCHTDDLCADVSARMKARGVRLMHEA